jgi:hypothetical protein
MQPSRSDVNYLEFINVILKPIYSLLIDRLAMKASEETASTSRRGKLGWIILWLLGMPLPILVNRT